MLTGEKIKVRDIFVLKERNSSRKIMLLEMESGINAFDNSVFCIEFTGKKEARASTALKQCTHMASTRSSFVDLVIKSLERDHSINATALKDRVMACRLLLFPVPVAVPDDTIVFVGDIFFISVTDSPQIITK